MSTKKMTFGARISRFFFDPQFYKEISKKTFSQALKHFLITMSFFGAVLVVLTILSLWGINKMIHAGSKELIKLYPDELVLTFKDGELTSNSPEPTYFSFESLGVNSKEVLNYELKNFAAIDTQKELPDEELNAFVVFTKEAFFVVNSLGRYEATPYPEEGERVISKSLVAEKIGEIIPSMRNGLIIALIIFMVIFAIFLVNAALIYLALFSLLCFCLSLISRAKWGMKKSYPEIFEASIFTLRPALLLAIPLIFFSGSILLSLSATLLTLLLLNYVQTR